MVARLPQFAERHFAALCASAGVVCNGADEDELGWDFFLNFPSARVPGRPADKHSASLEALVQVKSTRGRPFTARMKLSNALRAAQADQPFFVVLIVSESDCEPVVYARHFWSDDIARTLKRVRLAENSGDTVFNRRFFDIRFSESDRRDDLHDWMRTCIRSVDGPYSAAKRHLFNSVGHEAGFGSFMATVLCSHDEYIDLSLGLKESVSMSSSRFIPQRFGIAAAKPEFEMEGGELFLTPHGNPCRLRLQGGEPSEMLSIDATLYLSGLPGIPAEQQGWRVDAGPLRIVRRGAGNAATIAARYGERRTLAELNLFLALAVWNETGPIALQLFWNDQSFSLGAVSMTMPGNLPEWTRLRKWGLALEAVRAVAHAPDPSLSVVDLDMAEEMLDRFADFVRSSLFRVTYEPEGTDDPVRAAVYYIGCDVGEYAFLAVLERPVLSDTMDGGTRVIDFGVPRILDTLCRPGSWRDHEPDIEAAYRTQVARLGDPSTLWELGEFEAFVARAGKERLEDLKRRELSAPDKTRFSVE